MSESTKTIAFVVIGAAALVAAYIIDRPTQAVSVDTLVGSMLNTDFEVDAPKRLKIVKFDRQTADTRQFEVASVDGTWSIPSKENYPADATAQMAAAANALIDRKILRVAGETADSHDEFGVVDPLANSLDSNSTGVGTRVTMYDGDDKPLADMIIGKGVKGAEGQRYVRESNKDVVYIVELDPASLSTNFDDWIEDDLLKISPFDISKVFVNDYSADLGFGMSPDGRIMPQVNWERRGEITLGYNNDDAKWKLVDLKKYDRQKKEMVPDALAENEELNEDALSELRNGLDDLLIVDVAKKPAGLSADLKAGNDFMTNQEAFQDLIAKGFSPVPIKPNAPPEILSSEGEIICTTRDGVEYVLRFGQLKVQTDSAAGETEPADPATGEPAADTADPAAAAAATAAAAKEPTDEDGKNLHRYLFVMARFNEDAIEKPKLKELPAADPASSPNEAAGDSAEAGEATPPAEEPAAPPAGGDEAAAAEQPEAADETTPAEPNTDIPPANEPATDEPAADEPAADESADDKPEAEEAKDDEPAPEQPATDKAAEAPTEADKAAEERKAIEQENDRLQDQYKESIDAGKQRVAELNERFGDWYYVISNDVYKQIHLGRDQVIKKKDAPKEGAAGTADDEAGPLSALPNIPGASPNEPAAAGGQPAESAAPAASAPAQQ
jgi:hypothetical protein